MSKFSSNQTLHRGIHQSTLERYKENHPLHGDETSSKDGCPSSSSLDNIAKSRHLTHTCGREFLSIICSKCGHVHRILAGSRDRTCPACARQLYYRVFERYSGVISKAKRLKFLTLTWKPVKRQDSSVVREMGKALNRFMHRNPYVLWKGLLAVVECKKTRDGWFYYHIHCLYDGF